MSKLSNQPRINPKRPDIYIYISQYITYILAQGHKRLKSKFKHNLAERSNIRKYGQVITIKHLDQKKKSQLNIITVADQKKNIITVQLN